MQSDCCHFQKLSSHTHINSSRPRVVVVAASNAFTSGDPQNHSSSSPCLLQTCRIFVAICLLSLSLSRRLSEAREFNQVVGASVAVAAADAAVAVVVVAVTAAAAVGFLHTTICILLKVKGLSGRRMPLFRREEEGRKGEMRGEGIHIRRYQLSSWKKKLGG